MLLTIMISIFLTLYTRFHLFYFTYQLRSLSIILIILVYRAFCPLSQCHTNFALAPWVCILILWIRFAFTFILRYFTNLLFPFFSLIRHVTDHGPFTRAINEQINISKDPDTFHFLTLPFFFLDLHFDINREKKRRKGKKKEKKKKTSVQNWQIRPLADDMLARIRETFFAV